MATKEPYPGEPGATVGPKSEVPCRLEGLKVFVWLEKGSVCAGRVDEAENEQS